jgi:hypothetical protein
MPSARSTASFGIGISTEASGPRHTVATVTALLVVFALALGLRYPVAEFPFERDEGEYAYVAQRWQLGEIPYRDNFDQKPPAVFFLYLIIQRTLGTSPAALHWGATLYTLGTLTVVFALGKKLFSLSAGLSAAALVAFLTTDASFFGNAANTELFLILPLSTAFLLGLRAVERDSLGSAVLAGVLAMMALLCKQVALYAVVLLLLLPLRYVRRPWRITLAMLLGAGVTLAAVVGYFIYHRAGYAFYDCVLGYNLSYASRVPLMLYPRLFLESFRPILLSCWPIFLFASLAVGGAILQRRQIDKRPVLFSVLLVLLWLGACSLGTATGGYFYPHYFLLTVPPLALLAGAGVAFCTRQKALLAFLTTAAIILYGVLVAPTYYGKASFVQKCLEIYRCDLFAYSPAIADILRRHSDPEDTIFILGTEPQLLYYAERRSATRYKSIYPALSPFADTPQRQRAVLEEVAERDPVLIVTVFHPGSLLHDPRTPPDLFDGVHAMLTSSYKVIAILPCSQNKCAPPLEGEAAAARWAAVPQWYGTPPSRYALVVWQKISRP